MKLTKVWVVCNPAISPKVKDICWEEDVGALNEVFHRLGRRLPGEEETSLYTKKAEAMADARARVARARRRRRSGKRTEREAELAAAAEPVARDRRRRAAR